MFVTLTSFSVQVTFDASPDVPVKSEDKITAALAGKADDSVTTASVA